jgi:hypothetical protein
VIDILVVGNCVDEPLSLHFRNTAARDRAIDESYPRPLAQPRQELNRYRCPGRRLRSSSTTTTSDLLPALLIDPTLVGYGT